jgi:hypothetical protein
MSKVKVLVRIRPFLPQEQQIPCIFIDPKNTKVVELVDTRRGELSEAIRFTYVNFC